MHTSVSQVLYFVTKKKVFQVVDDYRSSRFLRTLPKKNLLMITLSNEKLKYHNEYLNYLPL